MEHIHVMMETQIMEMDAQVFALSKLAGNAVVALKIKQIHAFIQFVLLLT
jgi:hypothetical protein